MSLSEKFPDVVFDGDGLKRAIDRAAREGWTDLVLAPAGYIVPEGWDRTHAIFLTGVLPEMVPELCRGPSLRMLAILVFRLSALDITAIALRHNALSSLCLWDNAIGARGAGVIAETFSALPALSSLDLRGNNIGDDGARAIADKLSALSSLDLSFNNIGDDGVRAIADRFSALSSLNLSSNNIGDDGARAIADKLSALSSLDLRRNFIGDDGARAIADKLSALSSLDLRRNFIGDDGARAILDGPLTRGHLDGLDISGNNITLLPEEVLNSANAKEILAAYARFRAGRTEALNEAKLLVVGNEAVGKTSLIRFLCTGTPRDPDERKTAGIHVHEEIETRAWLPASGAPRLNVWDFGGQEIMHGTHRFFLTRRSLYLLVLEDRREDDRSVYTWLRTIANRAPDAPVLVVINKCDGGSDHLRLDESQLLRDWPVVVGVLRTSCNDDQASRDSVRRLRDRIASVLNEHPALKHIRDPLPTAWRRVKEDLAERARKDSLLSHRDFERLCEQGQPAEHIQSEDEQRALLGLLHDLGVIVAYGLDPISPAALRQVRLLDPNWLTRAIYTVLNSGLVARQGGVFAGPQLAEVLDARAYPADRWEFILAMMQDEHIGLCFPVAGAVGGGASDTFLVPEALPASEPFYGNWPDDSLRFRFQYELLPRSLIPRFIVEAHRHLADPPTRWRTGAVLKAAECNVLVRANLGTRRVDILVDGPPQLRRSALNIVLDDFQRVHHLNPETRPEARVPLPDLPDVSVRYQYLLDLENRYGGDHELLPDGGERTYRVADLLHGVRRQPLAPRGPRLDGGRAADAAALAGGEEPALTARLRPAERPRNPWVLLLSDLHVGEDADIQTMCGALVEDLRGGPSSGQPLAGLVISGDLSNRATSAELQRAHELIRLLLKDLPGVDPGNTVLVPGNHDVDWAHEGVYKVQRGSRPSGLSDDEYIPGKVPVVRDAAAYRLSWSRFSKECYQPLYGRPYPLDPDDQVDLFDLPDAGLCFVTFNSAWNTAEHSPHSARIVDGAVTKAARLLSGVPDDRLKIAVWHHPISGNEKIRDDAFVERLRNAGVRLCLHGHIHESRTDLLGYLHPRQLYAVGTGSFGAPWKDRAESTPRLYQLLELRDGRRSVRVYTRGLRKQSGAWGPWYEWPNPEDPDGRLPHFDVTL
jgi:GTPase SAR1 family protein